MLARRYVEEVWNQSSRWRFWPTHVDSPLMADRAREF
jgi:hypothetical protein